MKKVNGKPYLRTRIAFRGVVFRQPNDVLEENSNPYAGKSGIREKKKEKKCVFCTDVTFPKEIVYILR